MRKNLARLALMLVFLAPALARAQVNYQPYPVGERATGMGGAATALAEDESGAAYNPAGPAFSNGNSLSVSTSFYGLVTGFNADALGQGESFNYSTVNLIPTTASSLWHLGESTLEEPSPFILAFNVFAPGNFQFQQRTTIRDGAVNLYLSTLERLLLLGPTFAYRAHPRFAVGISLHGQINTFNSVLTLSDVRETGTDGINSFINYTSSQDILNLGMVAALGVRWEPTDSLLLGLSIRSPTIHFYGHGTGFSQVSYAASATNKADTVTQTAEGETRRELPLRINFGLAWRVPRSWALALDVNFYLPHQYLLVSNAGTSVVEALNFTVNGALGFEYYIWPEYPIRAGFFTDLSPRGAPLPGSSGGDRVDTFGLTLTGSQSTERTSTSVGVVASYSFIQTVGLDLSNGSYSEFITWGRQFRLFFVFASSFSY